MMDPYVTETYCDICGGIGAAMIGHVAHQWGGGKVRHKDPEVCAANLRRRKEEMDRQEDKKEDHMSYRILKYNLIPVPGTQTITVLGFPLPDEVCTTGIDPKGKLCLWLAVSGFDAECPPEDAHTMLINLAFTGEDMEPFHPHDKHAGTVIIGDYVFHVFRGVPTRCTP